MKRIIFLTVFAMLLGGFSVSHECLSLVVKAQAEEEEDAQAKMDQAKADKEKKEGEKGDPAAPHDEFAYIQLDSVTVPIITPKGLTQQLSIEMSLEVPYENKAAIAKYQPRLLDAYIQDLYGALGAGFGLTKNGVVDIQQIKQRIVAVTDKVLGPDLKAHDVLLQVVQQQPK
jgi:hypothetical protein